MSVSPISEVLVLPSSLSEFGVNEIALRLRELLLSTNLLTTPNGVVVVPMSRPCRAR